jgi:3-deoxy-D-manno-octulosonate 8-phosphate phosphatase KdsC-like HAD superfamily phosphatase
MANHLTPTELAREAGLERREVISKCTELGVPIFQGRIDKALFVDRLNEQLGVAEADHFTLLDGDGNLISSYDDRAAAQNALENILIAYDATGQPLGRVTRKRTAANA